MRIIAGFLKGYRLAAPVGDVARPTTDRVKESMFNLMGPDWVGGMAIDLFAGSGALGLEAVSRGADGAVFVDTHPKSLAAIRENVDRCRQRYEESNRSETFEVWRLDWQKAWARIGQDELPVGWVFVDPPYPLKLWEPVLDTIHRSGVRIRHGVVCEHPKNVSLASVGSLSVEKSKVYGDIAVTLFRQRGAL